MVHAEVLLTPGLESLLRRQCKLTNESTLQNSSFVTYNAMGLPLNQMPLLLVYDVFAPVFCKICHVIKKEKEDFFLLLTEYYDNHYHSYCIQKHQSHYCFSCYFFARQNLQKMGNCM